MKLPRDVDGNKLAKKLKNYEYTITRQVCSHMRLSTNLNGTHHVTIPNHKPIKPGTLNSILGDIAEHLKIPKQKLIEELFG